MTDTERLAEALWAGVQRGAPDECWPWMGSADRKGYGRVWVPGFGQFRTHRLTYQLTIGPISPGLYVCHSCDNPPCCNPAHLWMGTIRDNTRDMDEKGRRPLGERSVHSRLTVEQVREMRALHGTLSGREIARRYGVAQSTAMALLHRRTWTHV